MVEIAPYPAEDNLGYGLENAPVLEISNVLEEKQRVVTVNLALLLFRGPCG